MFELYLDIQKFRKKLTIKRHFEHEITRNKKDTVLNIDIEESETFKHQEVRPKSCFFPVQSQGHFIPTFFDLISADIKKITTEENPKRPPKNGNLSYQEIYALRSLENNENIIIRPADKGGGIVIQNVEEYEKEAHKILNDIEYYQVIDNNPFPDIIKNLVSLVKRAHKTQYINKK